MIAKKRKIKFENKNIELIIFRYVNIRNFEISRYRSLYISTSQILTPTHWNLQFFVFIVFFISI